MLNRPVVPLRKKDLKSLSSSPTALHLGEGAARPPWLSCNALMSQTSQEPRLFQAQLMAHLNRGHWVLDEMSQEDMSIKEVNKMLPQYGFLPRGDDEELSEMSDDASDAGQQHGEVVLLED